MERKTGSSGIDQEIGKIQKQTDYQLVTIADREKKIFDEGRFTCTDGEKTKSHGGLSFRKMKLKEDYEKEKPITDEKYLRDSYEETFQKHVNNLTSLISQHREVNQSDPKENPEITGRRPENSISKSDQEAVPLAPLTRLEIKTEAGINQIVVFGEEDDGEGLKRIKKNAKNASIVTERVQEDLYSEFLAERNPTITFNHVCTEKESNPIGFHKIPTNSRSPSPMLEIPDLRKEEKNIVRPPLKY